VRTLDDFAAMGCYPTTGNIDAAGPVVWQAQLTRDVSTGDPGSAHVSRSILEARTSTSRSDIPPDTFSKKDLKVDRGLLAVEDGFELSCAASLGTTGYLRVPVAIANRM